MKDVIRTYILHAEPVSSRSVAKTGGHGLSAASIRNVMADLEDSGFLAQPHTSAGRVPTTKAYHLYIRSMMDDSVVSRRSRKYIDERLDSTDGGADRLMTSASNLLSELSHQVGIVLTPAMGETVLKTVDFVSLSDRKVLCVVVSESGFVDNKVIQCDEVVPRRELVRISNYITEKFAGVTLRQARERLVGLMLEERARMDQAIARTVFLARHGLDVRDGPAVLLDGTNEVLSQPELSDIQRVRCMFDTFADKARLVFLLTQCMQGPGVRVLIGDESALTSELDFSLVTTTYRAGDRPLGSLGIFGPSRMEYQKVIPLVNYLGEKLSQALAETFVTEG